MRSQLCPQGNDSFYKGVAAATGEMRKTQEPHPSFHVSQKRPAVDPIAGLINEIIRLIVTCKIPHASLRLPHGPGSLNLLLILRFTKCPKLEMEEQSAYGRMAGTRLNGWVRYCSGEALRGLSTATKSHYSRKNIKFATLRECVEYRSTGDERQLRPTHSQGDDDEV